MLTGLHYLGDVKTAQFLDESARGPNSVHGGLVGVMLLATQFDPG